MRDLSGITTLLGSLGSGNNVSFDFSQYTSIKNGSYGKLMKAYYSEGKKEEPAKTTTSRKNKTQTIDAGDATGLSKLKSTSDELKKAAETITDSKLWSEAGVDGSSDKVKTAVKDFVNNYNKVIEQSGKVNSDSVNNSVKWMTSLTGVMQKSLGKIGITVGVDNMLTLNEDTLAKADSSSLKTLFKGNSSYGSEIVQKASSISSAVVRSNGIYTSDATVAGSLQSMFNTGV